MIKDRKKRCPKNDASGSVDERTCCCRDAACARTVGTTLRSIFCQSPGKTDIYSDKKDKITPKTNEKKGIKEVAACLRSVSSLFFRFCPCCATNAHRPKLAYAVGALPCDLIAPYARVRGGKRRNGRAHSFLPYAGLVNAAHWRLICTETSADPCAGAIRQDEVRP